MALLKIFTESTTAKYVRAVRSTPRNVIANRTLLYSSAVYAMAALPCSQFLPFLPLLSYILITCDASAWDQGSSSVVPSLKAFQKQFNTTSGASASQIQNFVSIIYIGYAVGSAMSFFINDRIGRRWSLRLYICVWIVGQIIATLAPGWPALYTARIVSGLGIGALSVIGPMSIVEIAPGEIRGLLTSWYNVVMGIALTTAIFCVYGAFKHMDPDRLQYQVVWFSPALFMGTVIVASFFISESPRWLMVVGRKEEAIQVLVNLRRMPADSPRLEREIHEIQRSIEGTDSTLGAIAIETFTHSSNLRRLQQVLLSYAFAQLSGANSVTSYFVPIMSIIGIGTEGGTDEQIFLSGMYGLSKFFMSILASFFLIDALGRRKSLFIGISLQMVSHIYLGVYIKFHQAGPVPTAASHAAVAALFIHALGYAIGKCSIWFTSPKQALE